MTKQHQITPPPELVRQWRAAASNVPASLSTDPGGRRDYIDYIATQAAQWGSDQELNACCEWLKAKEWIHPEFSDELRAARRPQPPSLKERALQAWAAVEAGTDDQAAMAVIRRALEALDD